MIQISQPTVPPLIGELHTNYVPTNEEVAAIKTALCGTMEKRQILDREISRLQARLDDLTLQKEGLNTDFDAHRRLLSPFRRLIPDILQEIFYHTLPTAHNSVMNSRECPLLLGRVCKQWRQIAFATPSLWTSIHVVTSSLAGTPTETDLVRCRAASCWLSRSGALPLSISIHTPSAWFMDLRTNPTNTMLRPYLDIISPFSRRWRSIHLTLHYFDWAELFNKFNDTDLPLLEKFHIAGDVVLSTPEDLPHLDLKSPTRENGVLAAPRLRVLSMSPYRSQILQFRIRWNDLTGLNLDWYTLPLEDVTQALILCPNLEFCTISVESEVEDLLPDLLETTLPKLRSLAVTDRSDTGLNTQRLFKSLYTPHLRHLNYRLLHTWTMSEREEYDQELFLNSLSSFLRRLIDPLLELDLTANSLSKKVVMKVLGYVPGLKRLSIKCYGSGEPDSLYALPPPLVPLFFFEDEELVTLIPRRVVDDASPFVASGNCLCPKLEVFHCTGAMFSDSQMIEFLRSRSVDHQKFHTAHLRRTTISFMAGRQPTEGTSRYIEALQEQTGMVVTLRHFPSHRPSSNRGGYSPYDGLWSPDVGLGVPKPPKYFGF